ncbi:MAG TPA: AgmX/PglI C-terminal domain-containing protein [Agitococcus sp.]|nr:AgmX/PglI C-terminal domain-containing protein [Agitococcus sp.]
MSTHLISGFLPWDELPEHSNRARKINAIALVLAFLCFVVIPFIKVPPVPRSEVKVPERVARAIERKIELPPPPPKPPEVKKEEKKEVKAEDKPKPKEEIKPKPIEKEPVAKPKATEEQVKAAKQQAQQQLASVADDLAALRDLDVVATSKPATGGLQKDTGAAPAGTSRNMLTSKAGASSGGVAYGGPASSGFGGGVAGGSGSKGNLNLGSKGTTDMSGKQIAAAGGSGSGESRKTRGEGGIGKRTQEDIRKIFDQNGGRLNNAYQRALKDDPSMEGTVRLKLTIDPSGKVTGCEVASSDLNNPELEAKIVSLVKGFNFGADEVEVWKGTYPVNFYPN